MINIKVSEAILCCKHRFFSRVFWVEWFIETQGIGVEEEEKANEFYQYFSYCCGNENFVGLEEFPLFQCS